MHPKSILALASVLGFTTLVQSQYNGYDDLYERDLYSTSDFHLARREAILDALYARDFDDSLIARDADSDHSHALLSRESEQVCEVCKKPLSHSSGQTGMTCSNCGAGYNWVKPYIIPSGDRKKDDAKAEAEAHWRYGSPPRQPENYPFNRGGKGYPPSKKVSGLHRISRRSFDLDGEMFDWE